VIKQYIDYRLAKDYSWAKVRIPKLVRLDLEYRWPGTWEVDGTVLGYKVALSGEPSKI
jgi:hypothetical protein